MRKLAEKLGLGAIFIIIGILCFLAGNNNPDGQLFLAASGILIGIGIGVIFIL